MANMLPPWPPGADVFDGSLSAEPEEDGVGSPLDPEGDKIGAWGEGDGGDGGVDPPHEVSPSAAMVIHLPEHAWVSSPSVAPYLPIGHLVHCWFGLGM